MQTPRTLTGSIAAPLLADLEKNELWKIAGRRVHKLAEYGMFEIPHDNLIIQITTEDSKDQLRLVILTKDESMRLEGNKLSLIHRDTFSRIDPYGKPIKQFFSTGNPTVNDMPVNSWELPQAGEGHICVMTLDVPLSTVILPVTSDATYNFHDDIKPLLSRKQWTDFDNAKK